MNEASMPSTKASFFASPIHCIKHLNYFDIYDSLLTKYVGTEFTFVEVGVLDGGSLFMWRHFFGEKARIIGIDLNPSALKWVESGFEIHIGDQTDKNFWKNFFKSVGNVDVLLDDGGHMNDQQTVTVLASLPHINDGGILMVEDTCTSFMKFDAFKKYSFISHMKREIDSLHSRSPELDFLDTGFSDNVHSITFFENICVINVDRPKCVKNDRVINGGRKTESQDFRYEAETKLISFLRKLYDGVSIDYLNQAQAAKHPNFARIVSVGIVRRAIRCFVIPLRALIYLCIKSANAFRFKKLIRQFLA
jgi:hypothetical protein